MYGDEYYVLTGDQELGPYPTLEEARLNVLEFHDTARDYVTAFIAKGKKYRVLLRVFKDGVEYRMHALTSEADLEGDGIPF